MIGRTLGRYRLVEQLGAGGMGVVYRAVDERLRRDVALKVLPEGLLCDEEARQRFQQEARALSQLNHPNIATAYDFDMLDGTDVLVMEYVDGESIHSILRRGAMPVSEVIQIGRELASGLQAAHTRRIIHRDLKPANLRISSGGRLKILDFGIAKLIHERANPSDSTVTETVGENVAGTLPYMAPEQLRGEPVDERADIYASGAVLYELVSGRRAFDAPTSAELTSAILRDEAPALRQVRPNVPAGLERIITKCMAKRPSDRYQSAAELGADLDRLEHSPRALPKSRKIVIAGVVAGLILAIAALWQMRRSGAATQRAPLALAVLPFRVLNSADANHLSVGLPDALITRLANIAKIRVRSTNSILAYEKGDIDPQKAGRALGCDFLLTGTIQQTTDRYRVNVQLLRAADGSAVWGKAFDPPRTDLLQLQDDLSEQVVTALSVQLSSAEQERVYRRYTSNAEAYDLYLKGRNLLARHNRDSIEYFDAALRIDSRYALAHAGKAVACAQIRINQSAPDETTAWEKCAKEEAQRALGLDPDLAEAHEAMAAFYRWSEFEWEKTIGESDAALKINPSLYNPHRYRGDAFRHMGLLDLVDKEIRSARENNPVPNPDDINLLAAAALWDGRYSDAVNVDRRAAMGAAMSGGAYASQAYFYLGETDRAIALYTHQNVSTVGGRRAVATRASFLAAVGREAEASDLLKTVSTATYKDHHLAYAIGAVYAQLGNAPEAVRWLRKAAVEGFICYPWYARDSLLKPLKGDAAFQQLLQELQSKWEENKIRFGSKTAVPAFH
jgi:TolB-like protein